MKAPNPQTLFMVEVLFRLKNVTVGSLVESTRDKGI